MSGEQLKPQPIIHLKQNFAASCVPTSISMIFSGFGIDISEQTLVDKYFLTAKLSPGERDAGVTSENIAKGMVAIIENMNLQDQLQIDVFEPGLWRYTKVKGNRYIVEAPPSALRKREAEFKDDKSLRGYYKSLDQLVRARKIKVYTANAKTMGLETNYKIRDLFTMIPEQITRGFYTELEEFIEKGHIVGPHGGLTLHARVLDGTRINDERWKYRLLDPAGGIYPCSAQNLVWVDSFGVRGDTFDCLFRVSPKEEELLNPQQYDLRSFLNNIKSILASN